MGAPKIMSPQLKLQQDLAGLDQHFFKILSDLKQNMIEMAAANTDQVMKMASSYMNHSAYEALQQFYTLYVGRHDLETKKEKINRQVDDLFDSIQAELSSGASSQEVANRFQEDEDAKKERLGLAGLQKQLEGLITLNEGIKEKVLPALSSMQFEDAVNQRMDHIIHGFKVSIDNLAAENPIPWTEVAESIASTTSSLEETGIYYRIVLKREPPVGTQEDVLFF